MAGRVDPEAIEALQRDLARKYRTHGARVDQLWREMGPAQRARAMKAGTPDGVVLRHPLDTALGNVYKFMPEWNLQDITAADSDFLLRMFEHRATKSLGDQYIYGLDNRPGDYQHIAEMLRTGKLQPMQDLRNAFTMFIDGQFYGRSFVTAGSATMSTLTGLKPAIDAGLCISQSIGELVLWRQIYLLQSLNIMVEDILDQGSTTRTQKKPPKRSTEAATSALTKLSLKTPVPKLEFSSLMDMALDRQASFDDQLALVCTEPAVLAYVLNLSFFSRPELLPDEKGSVLPAHTDKFISGAFLDTVHNAVEDAAVWNYICRLLELFKTSTGKAKRALILQEIANVCHFEYGRVQATLRRHVSIASGSKSFKRVANVYDNGNARITLKGKPEALAGHDQQLLCLLHLCQVDVTALKAVEWLTKLEEFHSSHPGKRDDLRGGEFEALGDLAVIVAFIQSLLPAISMPAFSRKRGQRFVTGVADLEAELNNIKPELDLADFAAPIDNLLEPGMAEAALKEFDQFIVEKTGSKIGFLYSDLINDCIAKLEADLAAQDEKERLEKREDKSEYVPFPQEPPKAREVRVQERRQKEKTRPTHSSVYEISPVANIKTDTVVQAQPPPPAPEPEPVKVKSATAEVFSTLFDRSKSRGSIAWVNFEAALADLGFSVMPRFGSAYTFFPPESMIIKRPFTLHRPHQSCIEGHRLLIIARRLTRAYGWRETTFQIA
ncbi:hypothetical protein GGR50DRAFT_684728 [Xylaria sp. CBS 124048]|nr:hypothetical protein GGR50DRAFT_684728 [Xylaria sp. CBS 124048]